METADFDQMLDEMNLDHLPSDFPTGGDDDFDEPAPSNEFAQMLAESFSGKKSKKLKIGDKVRGEILVLGKEDVYVSTGTQHDGVVSRRDLVAEDGSVPYKTGDHIDLYVIAVKGSDIRLSPKKTAKNLADDIEDAFDKMMAIEGRVAEVCKGGFRIAIHGKMAFCPISQLDDRHIETPEEYIGKRFDFMITQFTEGGRNIVVSRRKLLDEQRELSQQSFLAEHKAGEVVSGRVKRLEKFGAFIELAPGIEGLAHVSELAWTRVNDPSEVLSVGLDLPVKILKIEHVDGKTRIALSVKQASGTEPWSALPAHLIEGQSVPGTVTRCAKFGAFVEIAPGIEGLIPLGELGAGKRIHSADEVVKPGDALSVRILSIQKDARRISLSLRDPSAASSKKDFGSESEDADWKAYSASQKTKSTGTGMGTFGGAFGDQLKSALAPKESKASGSKKK